MPRKTLLRAECLLALAAVVLLHGGVLVTQVTRQAPLRKRLATDWALNLNPFSLHLKPEVDLVDVPCQLIPSLERQATLWTLVLFSTGVDLKGMPLQCLLQAEGFTALQALVRPQLQVDE